LSWVGYNYFCGSGAKYLGWAGIRVSKVTHVELWMVFIAPLLLS